MVGFIVLGPTLTWAKIYNFFQGVRGDGPQPFPKQKDDDVVVSLVCRSWFAHTIEGSIRHGIVVERKVH